MCVAHWAVCCLRALRLRAQLRTAPDCSRVAQRAALCAKNLRALNGQFCSCVVTAAFNCVRGAFLAPLTASASAAARSWVQSRLQDRPSDAWEADVRQYLAYVSEIKVRSHCGRLPGERSAALPQPCCWRLTAAAPAGGL
jgi:hypothetical protein